MWTKAFDSITHKSIWNALKSCGTEHDYISFLKKLYRDQKASVLTDEESNMFEIKKGTKQCDPLSSLLFNVVLQNLLKDDIQRWQKKKGMRIYLSTNMRFADDVLLFASSKKQRASNSSAAALRGSKNKPNGLLPWKSSLPPRNFACRRPGSTFSKHSRKPIASLS